MNRKLDVKEVFGERLYGRFRADGNLSGERFREDFIVPLLEGGHTVDIDFSEVIATPSSFFEEAFGGLVRRSYESVEFADKIEVPEKLRSDPKKICKHLISRLNLISSDEFIERKLEKVHGYMNIAAELLNGD